jgi:hypothetical protein
MQMHHALSLCMPKQSHHNHSATSAFHCASTLDDGRKFAMNFL